jgi:hypothetical protein
MKIDVIKLNFSEIKNIIDSGELFQANHYFDFWREKDGTYWFCDWYDGGEEIYHDDWEVLVGAVKRFIDRLYKKEYIEYED